MGGNRLRVASRPSRAQFGRRRSNQCRRYRLDADLHSAGPDDDHTRTGAFLWRHGPQEKCSGRVDAKFCDRVRGDDFVVADRLFVGIYAGPVLGNSSRAFFNGMAVLKASNQLTVSHLAPTIPESVYAMFQLTFAIITPALIAGAFADRMKFSAMLVFITLWSLAVYCPIAHWVWEPTGWLATKGVLDYAGGTVVHINAGMAGLASCLVLGKRLGYGREAMAPHNLTLTLTGAAMLWVGWFGFNAGSAGAADGRAGMAMVVTQVATAAAALSWMCAEWMSNKKPSVLGIASGAVAGLVAITPASGFVGPTPAVIIGLVAGAVCFFAATTLKRALGYDDSLDAFGVHGVGGIVGALLTGVFASKAISGVDGSVITQLWGIATTVIYGFTVSLLILKAIDMTVGLRVTEEQEREGLDISLHGEQVE